MHELADEVLGERKKPAATLYDFAAASARKGASTGRARTGSIYDWWHLVYVDLVAIADYHWFGGVPDGHRDQILFLMSVALSWYAHPDLLREEILRTARTFTPTLTDKEVETQMGSVLTRAHAAAAGKTELWHGKQVDPRYRFKAETLREWLGDLVAPELHPQLRTLAPAGVIRQRKKERDADRHELTREEYLAKADDRAVSARLMRQQGHTPAEIAAKLGISRMSVSRYLKQGDPM
jgi:hypothetical protein